MPVVVATLAWSGCGSGCGAKVEGAVCGDGEVEIGETCDDGNAKPGDGCSPRCAEPGRPPALSTLDLGLVGTINHSGWDGDVASALDAALEATGADHEVRAQVMYGSGFDAHERLISGDAPESGVNMYREAARARRDGQSIHLFGLGFLGPYLPEEDGDFLARVRANMQLDLPPEETSELPDPSALAGTPQVNVPYNIARIALETQADRIYVTPPYATLIEIADLEVSEEGTRRPARTFVRTLEDRIEAAAAGVKNTRALLERSRSPYRGQIKLFSAHGRVLASYVQRLPALLEARPALIEELRTLGGPEALARDYANEDFIRYPQDGLFVDNAGHFAPHAKTIFAHAVLMTRLAEEDVRYLELDLSPLVGGMSSALAQFIHELVVDAVRQQRERAINRL
jgi:cysteine-rich repeat protein